MVLLHLVASAGFDSYFAYGSLVVAVATVASFVIASGTVSNHWTIWLPVLDMAALGIYRLSDGTAVGVRDHCRTVEEAGPADARRRQPAGESSR